MELTQTFLNWVFAGGGALIGWVMKFFYDRLRDLAIQDQELATKVQAIELLVAGEYVKKDQLERMEERIFAKLEKIELKIDRKADKP